MPTIDQLRKLLEKEPDDIFLNYSLAMVLAKDSEEKALAQFDRVLELDPDYVPAWFQKGRVLSALDEPEEARKVLECGIEVAGRVGDEFARGEMVEFLETL